MEIEYDPIKRQKTLETRNLDFKDCVEIFNNPHIVLEDIRFNYNESRFITFGFLKQREIVIVWTPRKNKRRIISMRKANEREQKYFYKSLA